MAWRSSFLAALLLDHGNGLPDLRLVDEAGHPRILGLEQRGAVLHFVDRPFEAASLEEPHLLHAAVRPAVRVFEHVLGVTVQGSLPPGAPSTTQVRARAALVSQETGQAYGLTWRGVVNPDGTWEVRVPVDAEPARVRLAGAPVFEQRSTKDAPWESMGEVMPPAGTARAGGRIQLAAPPSPSR